MPPLRAAPCVKAALALLLLTARAAGAGEEDPVERGGYLVRAGGCFSCHTVPDGQKLAGGRALATPFGIFYTPNITADPETGIGSWTDGEFLRALREGIRPDGVNYFPVFPYTSFTRITNSDALAIKAYLFSLPAVHQENRPHDVSFPFSWRLLQTGWKLLFFSQGPFQPQPGRSAASATPRAMSSARHAPVSGWPVRETGRMARSFPISHPIPTLGSANGTRRTSSSS